MPWCRDRCRAAREALADAGDLTEQGSVHAEAAADLDGRGGAALEDGHLHPKLRQRDRQGQADQAAPATTHRTGWTVRRS